MRVCTLTFHPNAVHNSGQHERNHLCVPCLTLTPKIPTRFRGTHVRNDCAPCTHSKYFTHHWTDHLSPMKLSRYFRPDTSRSSCPVGAVRSALPSTRFPSWICTMVLKKKIKKKRQLYDRGLRFRRKSSSQAAWDTSIRAYDYHDG